MLNASSNLSRSGSSNVAEDSRRARSEAVLRAGRYAGGVQWVGETERKFLLQTSSTTSRSVHLGAIPKVDRLAEERENSVKEPKNTKELLGRNIQIQPPKCVGGQQLLASRTLGPGIHP